MAKAAPAIIGGLTGSAAAGTAAGIGLSAAGGLMSK